MTDRRQKRRQARMRRKRQIARRRRAVLFLTILVLIGFFYLGSHLLEKRALHKAQVDEERAIAQARAQPVMGFSDRLQHFLKVEDHTQLYTEPDDRSDLVYQVPKGAYIAYYGTEGDWMKVRYNNDMGYMRADVGGPVYDLNLFKVVDGILIVNATYGLPATYAPAGESPEALEAFKVMQEAVEREGDMSLTLASGYRTYGYDGNIPEGDQARESETGEIKHKAKKGHSEHQTGLAFDLVGKNSAARLDPSFENEPEFTWLVANAHKYGFILRYPKDKEAVTGYQYEPWHFRYVGTKHATAIYDSGVTLEEYLGLHLDSLPSI